MELFWIVASLFDVIVEYFCEILLEIDDQSKYPIILKGSFKVPSFMNKYFVEVRVVVLDFILDITSIYMR